MGDIKFENAQKLREQHPATFYAPEKAELSLIGPGDFVKVCAFQERFWVEVTAAEGDVITGRIDNDLITRRLKYNDIISFHPDNVYNILSARDRKKVQGQTGNALRNEQKNRRPMGRRL